MHYGNILEEDSETPVSEAPVGMEMPCRLFFKILYLPYLLNLPFVILVFYHNLPFYH